MDSKKILEMINDGEIEKLKELLADDIYKKELGRSGTNRYSAMKRYFKYVDTYNKATSYPARDVKVYGEKWNCFCDGYSIALTHEDLGSMECFGGEKYLDIAGIMKDFPLDYEIIDINEKIARAKSMGYKLTKRECDIYKTLFFWRYKEGYWKISLLDRAFGIINDGEPAQVYYTGAKSPLYIKTGIGIVLALPVNMKNREGITIIE